MRRRRPTLLPWLVVMALLATAITVGSGPRGAAGSERKREPRRNVFVNGDSLGVGTRPYLPRYLRGWRLTQSLSISRHAPEGVALLRRMRHLPRVVVMSLGTNDDPSQVNAFRSAVRSTIHMAGESGRRHCIVWPNIVRPPVGGASYAGYNRVLAIENRKHRNLRVVKWTRIVRTRGISLGSDGVHPTATGYRVRAKGIAREVRRCQGSR